MARDTAGEANERRASTGIDLPDRIVDRVESRLPRTRFDGVDQYVAYVLEEVLSRVEDADNGTTAGDEVSETEIQERLESLGYLE